MQGPSDIRSIFFGFILGLAALFTIFFGYIAGLIFSFGLIAIFLGIVLTPIALLSIPFGYSAALRLFSAILAIVFGLGFGLAALLNAIYGYYDGATLFASLAAIGLLSSAIIAFRQRNVLYLRGVWLALLVATVVFGPGGIMEGGLLTIIVVLVALAGLLTSLFTRAAQPTGVMK